MRRIKRYPVKDKNSLQYWPRVVGRLKATKNFIVIQIARYSPSMRLKAWMFRNLLGVKVGKNVSIGLMAMIDIFYPELITLGNEVILGYNCTILCHEFLRHEYRLGPVEIEDDVMIGANSTILPGVKIGRGAVVAAGALVDRDVSPYTMVGGVPARVIKKLQVEEQAENVVKLY
ncbi:MAG: acyltransferase [Thermoanaerobacteraceae bacterium]|nr:acyltransferase [Thermoanaerobacteraceae bacterium]